MTHSFSTAPSTVLPIERAVVLFDGTFSEPRLQHPEAVAIGPDGWIWCGSENGEILRIAPDGSRIELVAQQGQGCISSRPRFAWGRALHAPRDPHPKLPGRRWASPSPSGFGQPRFREPRRRRLGL
jgi:hypothetical protein